MKKIWCSTLGLMCVFNLMTGQIPQSTGNNNIQNVSLENRHPLEGIEASIDSLFHMYMNKDEPIQGAVIGIVASDSVFLSKGYGLANVNSNSVFDPIQTKVMVASVSKLITATAIFQLIEKGQIRLDQPVSELIGDLKIDNPFDQPVLIHHILTHTAGFDDSTIGSEAKSVDELESLKEHLERKLPPVVWEPGKYFNYSNLGMVLLAHVVELVSGKPFDAYLSENLYAPLQMNNSGFSYKDVSVNNMMARYKWKEDENNALYLDDSYGIKYTNQIGAGGFQTTANDMNNFMQMYLNKGEFNGKQVLKPATIQDAYTPHFYSHPLMDRKQGWVWRVRNNKGITYNYHAGDDTAIESIVVVFPDSDIAYFFASNNNEANELKYNIRDMLINRIEKEAPNEKFDGFISNTNLETLTGTYQYMNDGQSSVERLFSYLFGDVYEVTITDDTLSINGKKYTEIDRLLFQRKHPNDLLINFIIDGYGTHYSTGYSTYRKLAAYEKPSLHMNLLIVCFVIFLASVILWVAKYFKFKTINKVRFYSGLSAFLLLLFFPLLAVSTIGGTAKYGVPPVFYVCFTFPLIGVLFFALSLFRAPRFFLDKSISLFSKFHLGLVMTSLAACLLIYYYYNVIGYNF